MKEYIELIIDDILDDFTSRVRREFVYLTDDVMLALKEHIEHLLSGSFSEGLVNNADNDIIYLWYGYIVVNSIDHIRSFGEKRFGILIIERVGCNPGFVRLLVYRESIESTPDEFLFFNGKKYLNGQKLLRKRLSSVTNKINKNPLDNTKFTIKGPSIKKINNPEHMIDVTICYPFMDIHNIHNIQPIEEGFQFELPFNVCLVSKSHVDSTCPDIEFRWSFSIIENRKIRKFTDKEFQLYFICKELYNTYIRSNDDKSCISSYTIKTLIFYFRERNQEEIKSQSIIELVKLFLYNMKVSIREKYLQQYFVRDYNMFDVLKDDEAKKVLAIIENIETDLVLGILKCKFFNKFQSLATLCSIYETITRIGDFDHMKDDILKNIYIERSFKYLSIDDPDYILGKKTSIRNYLDGYTYYQASQILYLQIRYEDYWEVLCLYFHFSNIFKKYYKVHVIEKCKFLFERFIALYLMGTVPKHQHRHLIHLLIETLLHRLIYLPNPTPTIRVDDQIILAFYYFLCKKREKALSLLYALSTSSKDFGLYYDKRSDLMMQQFYPSSILSNDVILTKYMEKHFAQPKILIPSYIIFRPSFLYVYTRLRAEIFLISRQKIKQLLMDLNGQFNEYEQGLLTVLKDNINTADT